MSSELIKRHGQLGRIVATQRQHLSETDFIREVGEKERVSVNGDGDLIEKWEVSLPNGATKEITRNATLLFQPAISTTGDIELLRMEAELVAGGSDMENCHLPVDQETLEQLRDELAGTDLQPAWEVLQ